MWRALVIEDPSNAAAIEAALEPFAMDVRQVADSAAAATTAAGEGWDVIFCALDRPGTDGAGVVSRLRVSGATTPVVLTAAHASAAALAPLVRLGNVHYLAKPFTAEQLRALTARCLKQDLAVLGRAPRVLLQHADPSVLDALRALLPRHVQLEATGALAASLDLLARGREDRRPFDLVIVESRELADEIEAVAGVLRQAAPAAGVFAISDDASPDRLWAPGPALDGFLPRNLDATVARDYLYALFLRPLVLFFGKTARVAGYHGPAALRPAYLARVTRMVLAHTAATDPTAEYVIDVTREPGDADDVGAAVAILDAELRKAGSAASFRTHGSMRVAVTTRLPRVIVE